MSRSLRRRGPGARLGPQGRDAQKKKGGGPHRGNGRRCQQKFASTSVRQNSHHKKKPRKMPGQGRTGLFLAKNERPLQLRRAAWLTATVLPITVAGPRPICTALPHFRRLQIRLSVRCPRQGVNKVNKLRHQQINGSSSLASAFRPAPASLPGNLPGDKAR